MLHFNTIIVFICLFFHLWNLNLTSISTSQNLRSQNYIAYRFSLFKNISMLNCLWINIIQILRSATILFVNICTVEIVILLLSSIKSRKLCFLDTFVVKYPVFSNKIIVFFLNMTSFSLMEAIYFQRLNVSNNGIKRYWNVTFLWRKIRIF